MEPALPVAAEEGLWAGSFQSSKTRTRAQGPDLSRLAGEVTDKGMPMLDTYGASQRELRG